MVKVNKIFVILIMILILPDFAMADRYETYDPTDEPSIPPWWLIIYIIIVFWAGLAKKSPFKEWFNENGSLSIAIFIFIIPALFGYFLY